MEVVTAGAWHGMCGLIRTAQNEELVWNETGSRAHAHPVAESYQAMLVNATVT